MIETCSRKIHFCYGHRLVGHESKCATLHGHNGIIWVHATPALANTQTGASLDSVGRVVDFSVLKEKLGGWVDLHWDHTMIFNSNDSTTIDLVSKAPAKKPLYILKNINPTAENLAKYLLWEIAPKLFKDDGIIIFKIEFYETENCKAEAILDPHDEKVRALYGL